MHTFFVFYVHIRYSNKEYWWWFAFRNWRTNETSWFLGTLIRWWFWRKIASQGNSAMVRTREERCIWCFSLYFKQDNCNSISQYPGLWRSEYCTPQKRKHLQQLQFPSEYCSTYCWFSVYTHLSCFATCEVPASKTHKFKNKHGTQLI